MLATAWERSVSGVTVDLPARCEGVRRVDDFLAALADGRASDTLFFFDVFRAAATGRLVAFFLLDFFAVRLRDLLVRMVASLITPPSPGYHQRRASAV